VIALRAPHRPRPIRFRGLHDVAGWRIKLYGIATPGHEPRDALVEAALAVAASTLPQPPEGHDRYGLGFVVVHDAADYAFVLVDWWHDENEIHQQLFSGSLDEPAALRPHFNAAIGCVWELAVVDFERRAWLEHVLANPAGPDVAGYLDARFEADV
jgi:hypothetical protein